MERVSCILAEHLVQENVIAAEKSSIYQYGLQIGLEVCLNTVVSIVIAILCNMKWEAAVFFTVFVLLRSYAGGLHLNAYISCLICSCLSFWGLLLVVKYLDIDNSLSIGIVCFSLLLIKLLAPVQDINRPLSPKEMRRFGKRLNLAIVEIVILAVIFYLRQLDKMLLMISVTTAFMVGILVLGKIKYKKCIKNNYCND